MTFISRQLKRVCVQLALMYNSYSLDFDYMNTMMSFEVLGYRLEWTKKLMLPVPMDNSWSLYVVDVEEKTLLVMDPCETSNPQEVMKHKHEDNANIILEGLRRCIHANIAGWYVPSQGWRVLYNVGMHPSCEIDDSYLHVMNYIREFIGLYIYNPLTPNRLHYFRRLIAYEVISMRGNRAELPDFMVEEVPF